VDGNKRTALVAAFTFLAINGCEVEADETEAVQVFQELAAGDIDERSLADWLRRVGRRSADERVGDDGG
jgi:death-on-curing protein